MDERPQRRAPEAFVVTPAGPPAEPLRVLVAEDHPMYRASLARAIEDHPRLEVAGQARDADEARQLAARLQPDVALVDLRMPGADGLALVEELVAPGGPRVVVVSAFADSPTVHGALEAGAAGFLSKRTEEDELCRALLEVAAGRTVVSPDLHQSVFEQIQRRGRQERLSPREAEMLRLVADGHDHAEIGRRLALSPATVKTYLHRAYDKLGVSTSAAAVAEAMRRGLLR